MFITMTLVLRDADETFVAETETRPETFSLETETRPRHWKIPPRRDETRRRARLETVSRPRRRDRDYIPAVLCLEHHCAWRSTVAITHLKVKFAKISVFLYFRWSTSRGGSRILQGRVSNPSERGTGGPLPQKIFVFLTTK